VTFPVKRECNKAVSNALTRLGRIVMIITNCVYCAFRGVKVKPTRDRSKTINEIEKSKCVLINVYIVIPLL